MEKIKAYILLLLSGWRKTSGFGYPKSGRKYLVTTGDGSIIDICIYIGKIKKHHVWQQAGFCTDIYEHKVKAWKPVNSKWTQFICAYEKR